MPLNSHAWHVVNRMAFCPSCPNFSNEQCAKVMDETKLIDYMQLFKYANGIVWLAPQDSHFCGHSVWRIAMYQQAAALHDYETANWFLTHSRVNEGPESANNTTVPTEHPVASLQSNR